jgi:hypothetical protein
MFDNILISFAIVIISLWFLKDTKNDDSFSVFVIGLNILLNTFNIMLIAYWLL